MVAGRQIAAEHGMDAEQQGLKSPKLKGAPADVQRQIERRMAKYAMASDPSQLGNYTKAVSLEDWLEVKEAQTEQDDERRIASKL